MANDVPAYLKGSKHTGFEDMQAQDFVAPFLFICQPMSPYCMPDHPLYNPNAKPGMLINTLSGMIHREVHVIPVRYKFKNVVWKPRNTGGGFVESFDRENTPDDTFVADPLTGQVFTKDKNLVVQTAYYLCLLEEERYDKVIIGMSSTQLKKARKWNAMMQATKEGDGPDAASLAMYSTRYRLSTTTESNSKGKWYGWVITPDGWVSEQLFHQAEKVYEELPDFLPERLIAASRPTGDKDDDTI